MTGGALSAAGKAGRAARDWEGRSVELLKCGGKGRRNHRTRSVSVLAGETRSSLQPGKHDRKKKRDTLKSLEKKKKGRYDQGDQEGIEGVRKGKGKELACVISQDSKARGSLGRKSYGKGGAKEGQVQERV